MVTGDGAPAWETNTTLEEIAAWLKGLSSVVVMTHAKPDGDAAGSVLAITRALARAGVETNPAFVGPVPGWVSTLAGDTPWTLLETEADLPKLGDPDGVLITDTGSWSQLEKVRGWLESRKDRVAVVDHHRQGSGKVGSRLYVDVDAAAVCESIASLARHLLGLASAKELPRDIAEPLYVGIAADTGWFRHSNVTARVMRVAADLLEAGVDHPSLYELSEQQERWQRLGLMARALASLELLDEGRVAIMTVRRRDFEEIGAAPTDSGGFSDIPLMIATVRVAAVLTEAEPTAEHPAITKISLRSKAGADPVDVNQVAMRLGGGGHARAAGVRLFEPVERARDLLIEALGSE